MAFLSAANLLHRKTRTAVSLVAIALEVSMVMVMVGLADGTLNDVADRLQGVGADVLFQPPDASLILGASSAVMPLTAMGLLEAVEGVAKVTPVLNWHVSQIGGEAATLNLWAVDYPGFAAISGGLDVLSGQPLAAPGDLLVDSLLAESAHLRVGDLVPMLNRSFRVAGIFRAGAGGRIYARIEDIQDAIGVPGKASFFLVKARPTVEADALVRTLEARFHGYTITPIGQVAARMKENAFGLRQFKQALSAVAGTLSFLMILLAMYTAVIERTRELGILRALGATRAGVVRLVMTESALISAAGAALGLLFAVLGRRVLVHAFPSQTIDFTLQWTLIAVSLGFWGGVLGSVYPALRAARMDPVDALNFE